MGFALLLESSRTTQNPSRHLLFFTIYVLEANRLQSWTKVNPPPPSVFGTLQVSLTSWYRSLGIQYWCIVFVLALVVVLQWVLVLVLVYSIRIGTGVAWKLCLKRQRIGWDPRIQFHLMKIDYFFLFVFENIIWLAVKIQNKSWFIGCRALLEQDKSHCSYIMFKIQLKISCSVLALYCWPLINWEFATNLEVRNDENVGDEFGKFLAKKLVGIVLHISIGPSTSQSSVHLFPSFPFFLSVRPSLRPSSALLHKCACDPFVLPSCHPFVDFLLVALSEFILDENNGNKPKNQLTDTKNLQKSLLNIPK